MYNEVENKGGDLKMKYLENEFEEFSGALDNYVDGIEYLAKALLEHLEFITLVFKFDNDDEEFFNKLKTMLKELLNKE